MKKLTFLILIFVSINLYSQNTNIKTKDNDNTKRTNIEKNISKNTENINSLPFGDTYIPLNQELKDSIYWTTKTTLWGVSLGFFTTIYVTPYLEKNYSKRAVWNYFRRHCHQMMSRTMRYPFLEQIPENDFPVCARCQGIYTGYALGFLDSFIWDSFTIDGWERWEQGLLHIGTYSLLVLPLIIDGYTQKNTQYTSNNPWRFINGMMFGYAVTSILDEALQLVLDYENKF